MTLPVTNAFAGVHVVDFERFELPDGTSVDKQFVTDDGVLFVTGVPPSPGYLPELRETGSAHSGKRVLQIPPDGVADVGPALDVTLGDQLHSFVAVWVKNVSPGKASVPLQLQAFDPSGKRVDANTTFTNVETFASDYTELQVQTADPVIQRVLLTADPAVKDALGLDPVGSTT